MSTAYPSLFYSTNRVTCHKHTLQKRPFFYPIPTHRVNLNTHQNPHQMQLLLRLLITSFLITYIFSYTNPSIHPFQDFDQLRIEESKDPFGFKDALSTFKYSLAQFEQARNEPNSDLVLDGELVKDIQMIKNVDGSMTEVNIFAKLMPGLVNLGEYLEKEECGENTLKLRVKDEVKKWIPGTRFIVRCGVDKTPVFKLAIRRRLEQINGDQYVVFETMDIPFYDLFIDCDIHIKITPKDKAAEFRLLNWNYDWKNQKCKNPNKVIFQDPSLKVTCVECYGYMNSSIDLWMKVNWKRVETVGTKISGNKKLVYHILAELFNHGNKQIEKLIFNENLYRIPFNIGPVPAWVDFDGILTVKAGYEFSGNAAFKTNASVIDNLLMGMDYDYARQKGQKFQSYKSHEKPTWSDVIPKVSGNGNITAKTHFSVIPELQVRLYSSIGIRLFSNPTIYTDYNTKQQNENTLSECGEKSVKYDRHFAMGVGTQMTKLKMWRWEWDLWGLLPFPKTPLTVPLIPKLRVAKGCIPLSKL